MNVSTNVIDMDQARLPRIGDFHFWTDFVPDRDKPGELKPVDRVSWVKIGDQLRTRISESIARLQPNREKQRPAALEWPLIEPAYKAWKAGEELPENGTPLAAWPGCDRALADALKPLHVKTVEDFALMTDTQMSGIPVPDIRRRKELASAFLAAQKGSAHVAAELAKRDEQIANLQTQIEQLTAPAEPQPVNVRPVARKA